MTSQQLPPRTPLGLVDEPEVVVRQAHLGVDAFVGASILTREEREHRLAEELAPGATPDEVRKAVQPANVVPSGSSAVDGVTVEEWKIEAFNDSDKGRDLFVRFYHFVDGRLVDTSDRRIDFRGDPEVIKGWTTAK